jgi:hypothetical protein
MPHGYPQSKNESQGVQNKITALVVETRNIGLFQLVLPSGFRMIVGMISDVSVEGKARPCVLKNSAHPCSLREWEPPPLPAL